MLAHPCRCIAGIVFVLFFCCPLLAEVPAEVPAAPSSKGGWTTHEKKAAHFSIAVPDGWKVVELDPALVDASLNDLGKINPELGKIFGPQVRGLVAAGIKFLAVDAAVDFSQVGFATNVNVLTEKMPSGVKIADNLAANAAQLQQLTAVKGQIEQRLIEVGGRQAGRLQYRMLVNPATGLEAAITQIFMLVHGSSLVVTFTTVPAQSAKYAPVFAGIVERFRLLD